MSQVMEGKRIMVFWFLLLGCSVLQMLVHGQETDPGFISIDCGSSSGYNDDSIDLNYASDDQYVDSGKNMLPQVSVLMNLSYINQQCKTLRSFPNGKRNCYRLKPAKGKKNTYLIRASFLYGNYDSKNQEPIFDLHIGVNYWTTVYASNFFYEEIIYVAPTDVIEVCLINTGNGIPYISALELRLLDNSIYQLESMSLVTQWHYDIGRGSEKFSFRYPNDIYDRIWSGNSYDSWLSINTSSTTSIDYNNDAYKVPTNVLMTAQTRANGNSILSLEWPSNTTFKWCIYFHFVELQSLPDNQQREFDIFLSNALSIKNVRLEYLKPLTVPSPILTGSVIKFEIKATDPTSQYPPILNAVESFTLIDHPNVPTSTDDVNAAIEVKKAYNMMKDSWQGDPCVPNNYIWEGLSCSYGSPPRVVSLNLSSSMLTGDIARATSLSNLLALETLDMSHNQLTGQIPEFFGKLPNLKVLDLSGNNLSGSIPETIQKKVADQSLKLSVSDNPNICRVASCQPKKKKNTGFIIPVLASVSTSAVLLLIVFVILRRVRDRNGNGRSNGTIKWRSRSFTYNEVLKITENFTTAIGEGGFGKVYLGTLADGTKVAVKVLSQSSNQGFREFQSEAQLLTVVHHKNLVSLVGYCDNSQNMVLIYEFMARGNLREHLAERNPNILTWSERLGIALDAAQGLDYLHNGCKPPIIHRDLKTPNILLNESMQAKIADFGLSKAFGAENDTHILTRPAGTPGYLDPEFQSSGSLNRKSDVYSFGIIILELVTGHPPIMSTPRGNIHILQWVTPIIESGDIQRIVDPRLKGQFSKNSAWKVVEIAMSCVPMTAIQRPDISGVLAELKECWDMEMEMAVGGSRRMGSIKRRSAADNSMELASVEFDYDSAPMAR